MGGANLKYVLVLDLNFASVHCALVELGEQVRIVHLEKNAWHGLKEGSIGDLFSFEKLLTKLLVSCARHALEISMVQTVHICLAGAYWNTTTRHIQGSTNGRKLFSDADEMQFIERVQKLPKRLDCEVFSCTPLSYKLDMKEEVLHLAGQEAEHVDFNSVLVTAKGSLKQVIQNAISQVGFSCESIHISPQMALRSCLPEEWGQSTVLTLEWGYDFYTVYYESKNENDQNIQFCKSYSYGLRSLFVKLAELLSIDVKVLQTLPATLCSCWIENPDDKYNFDSIIDETTSKVTHGDIEKGLRSITQEYLLTIWDELESEFKEKIDVILLTGLSEKIAYLPDWYQHLLGKKCQLAEPLVSLKEEWEDWRTTETASLFGLILEIMTNKKYKFNTSLGSTPSEGGYTKEKPGKKLSGWQGKIVNFWQKILYEIS